MPDSPLDGVRSPLGPKPGGGPAPAFSPTSLYSSGSQGIWLDPSDLATMFSDRAGTTPVTTPGTVVGLRLDKSKGLTLGSQLVVNGTFPVNTSGWNAQSATLSVDTERLKVVTVNAGNGASQVLSGLVVGKTYKITVDVTTGAANWGLLLGLAFAQGQGFSSGTVSGSQTYSRIYTHTNAANNVLSLYSADAGTIFYDNISVRELAGNHAVAPTDAARPIYGVEPKGGRRNLLTWSEDFGNAVWTKGVGATATSTTLKAVAGTGNHWIYASGVALSTQTFSIEARADTASWIALGQGNTGSTANTFFNLSTGTVGTVSTGHTASIVNLGGGWYRCIISQNFGLAFASVSVTNADNVAINYNAAGTEQISIRNAQLELGSTATNYQRVLSAYDITESGVATCHYVQYDGSDDSMSTSAIDFTATDKMSVFAGVRKLSDAATGTLLDINGAAGIGTIMVRAPSGTAANYAWFAGGSLQQSAISPSSYAAPISNVLTGLADISGDLATLRVNGVQAVQTTTDQGTGNFSNLPLFFGRRQGTSLPFNGKDYGIIIVGKTASAGEITDTETWLAARTSGVSI